MLAEMQRYKGVWGGIMLVVTAIGTAFALYVEFFRKGGSI